MVKSTGALGGVKWTGTASVVTAVTQLFQVAILARFLSPTAFGLMSLALLVVGISQIFLDAGVSNAIIYKQETDSRKLSTLYWFNIFLGVVIFGIVYLSAPVIAAIFAEEELHGVIQWISVVFLIQPWGQQYYILLQKKLDFKGIAWRDIISKIAGLIAGVLGAVYGMGVYALVISHVCMVLISTIFLITIGVRIHKPQFYFRLREVKDYIQFGMYQLGERGINYFNLQVDTLIIGKILGVELLGIYTIAKDLVMKPVQLINPIITKVAFPIMAKLQQDLQKMREVYLQTIRGLISINAPVFTILFLFARPIVLIMFGEEWIKAIPIIKILSLYMLLRSAGNPVGALQLARGRADLGFYWNLALGALIPITVYIGSSYGLVGVAYSLLLLQVMLYYPSWRILVYRLCGATLKSYNVALGLPVLNAAIIALLVFLLYNMDNSSVVTAIVAGFFFLVAYAGLSYFTNNLFRSLVFRFINHALLKRQ